MTHPLLWSLARRSLVPLVGAGLLACSGGSNDESTGPGDTGQPVEGGVDAPFDTHVDAVPDAPFDALPDALPDVIPDAPVPLAVKVMTLTLSQTTTVAAGATTYATMAAARFLDTTSTGDGKCSLLRMGACDVVACDLSASGADAGTDAGDGGAAKTPDAGDIHFDAPKNSTELHADAFGLYAASTGTSQFFAAGDTVTTTSSGNEIPGWSDQPVTAPGDMTLTAPTCASGACADVDRTVDLSTTWTGATSGDVTATLVTTNAGTKSVVVSCTFKAADGKGTVPAAALAKLDAADGTAITGFASIAPSSSTSFKSGAFDVLFLVGGSGGSGTFKVSK